MATATDEIYVKIIADASNAISSIANLAKEFAGAYLSIQSFKALIVDSIKAYTEAEDSQIKLGQTLRATGQYSREAEQGMLDYAKAIQNTSIFSHEMVETSASVLMSITHLNVEGVQQLMPHLTDFASMYGIDLPSAARMAAAAIEGGRNQFQRYGIDLKGAHDPTERFNELIKALAANVGGMSDALSKTTGGQLKQFKNQMEELKETMGQLAAVMLLPGLRMFNQQVQGQQIMGSNLESASLETLKLYQKSLFDLMGTLQEALKTPSPHNVGTAAELTQVIQTMAAVTDQIRRVSKHGAVVTAALGDNPDASVKYLYDAKEWLMYYFAGHRPPETIMSTASAALAMAGTGMENPSNRIPQQTLGELIAGAGAGGGSSSFMDTTKAVGDLANEFKHLGDAIANSAGRELGNFFYQLGTGASAEQELQKFISSLASSIGSMMIAAGLKLIIAGGPEAWPIGLALIAGGGLAELAGGALSGSGSSTSSAYGKIPHYASGTDFVPQTGLAVVHQGEQIIPAGGSRGVTVNVYGGVWQADDLARQVANAMGRW